VFAKAREINLEMLSEMETGVEQNYRSAKRIKVM